MKLLVKTCCKIIYHVLNKRFMTKEILPCMAINTNFGEIRCPPPPHPQEKIDGNVNCPRRYRHTYMMVDSVRQGLWYGQIFSPSPLKSNSLITQIIIITHNPLLTLLFVRLFPTSCFVNDFTVESLPRLFSTFEAPCFAAFLARQKNDRVSCKKKCNYNWNTG